MTVAIRALRDAAEVEAAFAVFLRAMIGLPTAGAPAAATFTEPGRYLGAFDGDALVGGADSFTSGLMVPGGAVVVHAAVTRIGVLPTHTRRGVLTALMTRQLQQLAQEGAVAASLHASEGSIYGRFGYGVATRTATFRLGRRRARLLSEGGSNGRVATRDATNGVRLLGAPADPAPLLAPIYRAGSWAGAIERPARWWRLAHGGAKDVDARSHLVVHGPPGREDGYLLYRPADRAGWFAGGERTLLVEELIAHSCDAYRALLCHLLALDLIDTIELPARPVDDPLPALLSDPRAAAVTAVVDETWLRLVDVERALAARSYEGTGAIVVEVFDPLLPGNAGRYEISAAGATRTRAPAQLRVGVDALAAVYLGDARWWQLSHAGRVVAVDAEALATAERLFATARLPFAGTFF